MKWCWEGRKVRWVGLEHRLTKENAEERNRSLEVIDGSWKVAAELKCHDWMWGQWQKMMVKDKSTLGRRVWCQQLETVNIARKWRKLGLMWKKKQRKKLWKKQIVHEKLEKKEKNKKMCWIAGRSKKVQKRRIFLGRCGREE